MKVKELRSTQAKEFEIVEAILALLEHNPTVGDHIKTLFGAWSARWGGTYTPDVYSFNNAADAGQFKRLLKTLPVEEIEIRMAVYLATKDPFYVRNRHPLGIFVKNVNQFGRAAGDERKLEAPTIDCKHTPPCGTDQEHTKRRMQDMRAPF